MKLGKRNISWAILSAAVLLVLVVGAGARPPRIETGWPPGDPQDRPNKAPQPITVDQVIHNKGNIVTTVDNWGYVGGYEYYGLPSGEWPRNSGHSYLAEMMYWIGAVTSTNDTLVADAYEDFQAIPELSLADNPYKILLSTDSTRYLEYSSGDTVGLGMGYPAYGWRVWNPDSVDWVYNRVYDPLGSSFFAGGPTSLQESHYRFNDAASGSSLLGLEMTHSVLQWNYCYNEDFLFVVLNITNISTEDYTNLAFGLYVDIDVGGPDGRGENGRLEDVVVFDSTENLAWIYDNIGIDPGWGPTVRTGLMGTKLLETPDNIGMTAFRTDDWAFLPDQDPGRYAFINSQQFDQSLPPTDQFYLQCVRGINLSAGKTVRVVYALVAGANEEEFRNNAAMAQQLYDNYYIGPQPPPTPTLLARAANRKVYLSWNDTSEVGLDPLSGTNDFAGYKLYRSDNQGKTWGVVNYRTNNNCLDVDYTPLALYTVSTPGDPIPHSVIDTGLHNGVEYWYCLTAFDVGDTVTGVDPLQSGFGIAGAVTNVVAATPTNNPAGFTEAAATVTHNYTGSELRSDGEVTPSVFDRNALTGAEYRLVFEDTPEQTYWHLINETTGDTVLARQTKFNESPGMFDIAEGLRVVVSDGDHVPRGYGQTALGGTDTTLAMGTFYGAALPAFTGDNRDVFGGAHFRSTYQLRYTGDSTRSAWVLDGFYGTDIPYWVPFEAWNTSTNQRVSLAVYDWEDDGDWDPYDLITIVNYPYNPTTTVTPDAFPYYYSWMLGFDDGAYNPVVGDVFTIEGAPLNGPDDNFSFKVDAVSAASATRALKDIRVVPNPYFARYSAMVETAEGESVVEFQKIPDRCTIRIYTLTGDLVQTIDHRDGTGAARWNLLSKDGRQAASGVYLFHVESPYGEHLGRFAIIK
ncbi:MAG TPA: hypothetical protein VN285_12665 [Candidatus Deferrimicrobium sp.]|nr:hypothetical protein [Candidatus Deferrimicrobium sp.]